MSKEPDIFIEEIIKDYTHGLKSSLFKLETFLMETVNVPVQVISDLATRYSVLRALFGAKYGICQKCGNPKKVEILMRECKCEDE